MENTTHDVRVATLGPLTAMADLYLETQISDDEVNVNNMLGEVCDTYKNHQK